MGFSSRVAGGENWGMGLLFVFFPDDPIVDKTDLFSPMTLRRSNSNPILSKAQSTISICLLLVFLTLLLFTLSTFEPSITKPQINPSRRLMSEKLESESSSPNPSSWVLGKLRGKSSHELKSASPYPVALQGMGALFRRGTTAMSDLIVAHLAEDVTDGDLRLFLRLLHRSGLTARSDLVLIFDSIDSAARFGPVIESENESFLRLIDRHRKINLSSVPAPAAGFNVTQFVKSGKEPREPLWGKKKNRSNETETETESSRVSYGSVVGFDVAELDPENSLSGFVGRVPMGLRRWACYPMLLGRVRRNFKHTMLVDVKNSLVLGDPLGRVRNLGAESVLVSAASHGKKNSGKTRPIDSAVVMGGSRGVRRLGAAVLTEIARAAMQQHRKTNSVTDSGVLSQLAGNEIVLKTKGVNLVTSAEPVPDSVIVIHRGNSNKHHEVSKVFTKQICASEVDSFVYRDC